MEMTLGAPVRTLWLIVAMHSVGADGTDTYAEAKKAGMFKCAVALLRRRLPYTLTVLM
jgi:hypothetical protein